MRRTLDEYLALPYTITLQHDSDDEGAAGFVAEVRELPGCISQGATPEAAVSRVYDAMAGWISVALEDGTRVPEPRDPAEYSGRFLLRIARSLHAELAQEADEEGVSLNQYVATVLAHAVGQRGRTPA